MIKDKLGHKLDQWIHVAFPFLFKWRINPNALTVIGAGISAVAALAFGRGEFLAAGLLLAAGGFCDLVDGVVARHFGSSSAFGGFLDSTLDRLVDMVVLLALAIYYAGAGDPMTAVVAGIGLVSSVLTSYTKARAEAMGVDLPGGIIERGERIGLLMAGGIFDVMVPALWVLAVGATATVVQRFTSALRSMDAKPLEPLETDIDAAAEPLAHVE